MHHSYIGTEHILLGLLKEGTGVASQVLADNGVEYDKVLELIEELIALGNAVAVLEDGLSPRAAHVLEVSKAEAARFHSEKIGTEHLLIAMIKETECVASRLLNTLTVNVQKMYVDTLIAMGEDVSQYKDEFQNGKPGKRKNAEGTPSLDQFSRDLTELARDGKLDPVVGREAEIDRVIQILSRRSKNNPCLIGEPGVGKTAIVEELQSALWAEWFRIRCLEKEWSPWIFPGLWQARSTGVNLRSASRRCLQRWRKPETSCCSSMRFIPSSERAERKARLMHPTF